LRDGIFHISIDAQKQKNCLGTIKKSLKSKLKPNDILLDMGTGGGELLLSLKHPHQQTYVTESYQTNYKLCKERLEPLGIKVEYISQGGEIPFHNAFFDIIINRHDEYQLNQVYKALKPGGLFITQQVGHKNNLQLAQKVLGKDYKAKNEMIKPFEECVKEFKAHGFIVETQIEANVLTKYFDCYTLVYFCKIIEWEFPNFSVDAHIDNLRKINLEILENGYVEGQEHRWIIVARKPNISLL
jgi:SAM-dependent methyltransferase